MTVEPRDLTGEPASGTNGVSRRGPRASESENESLRAALEKLRLEGAIFLRAEYTEAWALGSEGGDTFAHSLHGSDQRIILFHVIATGRCWVSLADGEKHWASAGDVIVLPYGDDHTMGGSQPAMPAPIGTVLSPPPWRALPVIRHGQGGERTDVVCGFLRSDDVLFDPSLRAFPPIFAVRPPEGTAKKWVEANIQYAMELSSPNARLPSTRLPELLLVEVLKLHLATTPAAEHGWLAALRDPVLAPAMTLIHNSPDRKWTVRDLAAGAAVSRSLLDARFRKVLGRSPIRYLTDWRMHMAQEMLTTTEATVVAIARRVGYDSEEAFSRAFKRFHGQSPTARRVAKATSR